MISSEGEEKTPASVRDLWIRGPWLNGDWIVHANNNSLHIDNLVFKRTRLLKGPMMLRKVTEILT